MVGDLDDVDAWHAGGDEERLALLLEVSGEQDRPPAVAELDDQRVVVDGAHRIGRGDGQALVARPPHVQRDARLRARGAEARVDEARPAAGELVCEVRERACAAARASRLDLGGRPQLADRDGEGAEAEVVVRVGVRDDRDVDPVVAERGERARDRDARRARRGRVARVGTSARVDQPHRAIGQLDERGVALADVEERHPQGARRRRRATERPHEAHRDPRRRVAPRPPPPRRQREREHDKERDRQRARERDPAHRRSQREQLGELIDPRDEPGRRADERLAELAERDADQGERQRRQLEQRREHEVADDASRRHLVEVVGGDRRGGDRHPRRRREAAREVAADPPPIRARAHRERERRRERELERRIEEVGRAPREDRDRRGAQRVDEPHRAIEHRGREHERDHDQRAHRRELRAGDQRVGERERERRRGGPPRGAHASAPG